MPTIGECEDCGGMHEDHAPDCPQREPALAPVAGSAALVEAEQIYDKHYEDQLADCDRWIKWCEDRNDAHGMNFHQGMRSALIFNDIRMRALLRSLARKPNPKLSRGSLGDSSTPTP